MTATMNMNALTLFLLIMLLALGCSERWERLSSQERSTITNLIAKENVGRITEIEPMRDGTVRVYTQYHDRDGGGLLTLAKTNKEWRVVLRGAWMN